MIFHVNEVLYIRGSKRGCMDNQYKKLSINYPSMDYRHLKFECIKQDISLKDFVTQAIEEKMEKLFQPYEI